MQSKPPEISEHDWQIICYGKRMKQQCHARGIFEDETQLHVPPIVFEAIQQYNIYVASMLSMYVNYYYYYLNNYHALNFY